MSPNTLARSAATGIIGAIVAVVIVYLIADAASGPLMATGPGGDLEEVPVAGAIVAVIIGGLVGVALAFLVRNRDRAVQTYVGICLVALVLYGIFAFVQADDLATGIWLNIMHIVAAVAIVGMLTRWLQTREQAST